jgi:hypothetical protein
LASDFGVEDFAAAGPADVASHAARPRWYSSGVTSGTKPVTDVSMLTWTSVEV